ncbi:hypothetical protein BJV82DRAFT_668471 [Fennellomyces sp. T-0311]|nr:hypothetical protein BJV82DRAFT_668471 [Fennellomyces sp. T-0311]
MNHHPHPNSLTKDYEYRIYDRASSHPAFLEQSYAPIIVAMDFHEGFHWNQDLFVHPFRRGSGYTTRKSADRLERETRVSDNTTLITRQHEDPVVEIRLSDADRDIWPQ